MKTSSHFIELLALSALLFVSTGCMRADSESDSKNGEKTPITAAAEKRSALDASRGGVVNVTRKRVQKSEKTPEEILLQDMNTALKKSHEIFGEVWAHIWQDRMQRPMSVFSEMGRLIQSHVDPATGRYVLKMNRCSEPVQRASEIEIEKAAGQISGAVFYRIGCAPGRSERTEMGRMLWKPSGPKGRAEWTFYAENMPRGAGAALAFLKERIRCSMNVDEHHKLDALECQNVGQNRDSEMHMRFDRFNYKRGSDTLVLVEGKKYKLLTTAVCDEPRFCTQVKVPLVGRIDIFEDVVSEEARDTQKRIALEEERKEAQEDLEKRIKEQKLSAETQAQQLKLRAQRMQVEGARAGGALPPDGTGAGAGTGTETGTAPSASFIPGQPFGGPDGVIAPASSLYAPNEGVAATPAETPRAESADSPYEPPRTADEDPAAQGQTGVYEFNHDQNASPSAPQVERQAGEGLIR